MPVFNDDDRKPVGIEEQWKKLRQRYWANRSQWRQVKRDDAWQNDLLPARQSVLLPLPVPGDDRTIFWWDEMPLPFFQQGETWQWQTKDQYRSELRRILAPWLIGQEEPSQAERRAQAKESRTLLHANVTLMLPGSVYCTKPLPIVDFIFDALCEVVDIDYALIDQFMPINREQIVSALRPFAKVDIYLPKE